MFKLEYAQYINGRFVAWQFGGLFASARAAALEAQNRGLTRPGDSHLISEADEDE